MYSSYLELQFFMQCISFGMKQMPKLSSRARVFCAMFLFLQHLNSLEKFSTSSFGIVTLLYELLTSILRNFCVLTLDQYLSKQMLVVYCPSMVIKIKQTLLGLCKRYLVIQTMLFQLRYL
jgi:hypothetical protein